MSKPIHTPGPLHVEESTLAGFPGNGKNFTIHSKSEEIAELPLFHRLLEYGETADYLEAKANARLLAAAYNAFDSAAKRLDVNAVELAERLADGGIAELVEAVRAAKEFSDWFVEHSRQADHAFEELKQPLHETAGWKQLIDSGYNGLMASYQQQFEEVLAKVKGGRKMTPKTLIERLNAQKLSPGGDARHIHNAAFDKAIAIIRQWAQEKGTVEAMKDEMLAAPMGDKVDGHQSYEDLAKAAVAVVVGAS